MCKRQWPVTYVLFAVFFSLALTACGGGAGSESAPVTVSGTVLDSNGSVVANATVTINSHPVVTNTNRFGFFSALVHPGDHTLTVTYGGLTIYQAPIAIDTSGNMGNVQATVSFIVPPDTDVDGVVDTADQCLGTAPTAPVSPTGCAVSQVDCDDNDATTEDRYELSTGICVHTFIDDDSDGVTDAADQCPNTPTIEAADANGCSNSQLDDDGDGVQNGIDQCPATPAGELVSATGCAVSQVNCDDSDATTFDVYDLATGLCVNLADDADGDGEPNTTDTCPNTVFGEAVDAFGCADTQKDSDQDGLNDALDVTCPNTPLNAREVNAVGCAAVELDDDLDGVSNLLDDCPNSGVMGTNTAPVNENGCRPREFVRSISAGGAHTCVITPAGGVQCWGRNDVGQIGDGSTLTANEPQPTLGLDRGVAALASGNKHNCAVTIGGAVNCWGDNFGGQLGNGTIVSTQSSATPVRVSGLNSGITAVATGLLHSCALTSRGQVTCWGNNQFGQLGTGDGLGHFTPAAVIGVAAAVAIGAGDFHTCALIVNGEVRCWGNNVRGQLGDGTSSAQSEIPVTVRWLNGPSANIAAKAISVDASYNCALNTDDQVLCWGRNHRGQLGNGTTQTAVNMAGAVVWPAGQSPIVTGITVGKSGHTCAVTDTGAVWCWGSNDFGQLGNNSIVPSTTPVLVSGLAGPVADLALGFDHTCALSDAGGVQCWGKNDSGQFGDLTFTPSRLPVHTFKQTSGVANVGSGGDHTCAVTTARKVMCWGKNNLGQLGTGDNIDLDTPVEVVLPAPGAAKVVSGRDHSCALSPAGGVKCWGNNSFGQLGNDTTANTNTPVDVVWATADTAVVVDLVAGDNHTCARTNTGGVRCWGHNGFGQLGSGTSDSPTPIGGPLLDSGTLAISAGANHTCAVRNTRDIWCWGNNTSGELGNPAGGGPDAATVVGLTGEQPIGIGSGPSQTCATTNAGVTKCWGANIWGQLGIGTNSFKETSALTASGFSNATLISGGSLHTCAIVSPGTVKCAGLNDIGRLGVPTATTDSNVPVDVDMGQFATTDLSAGDAHTCAVTVRNGFNATLRCWGGNAFGQLGDGTRVFSDAPVVVNGGW